MSSPPETRKGLLDFCGHHDGTNVVAFFLADCNSITFERTRIVTSKHLKDASLMLSANVRLSDETIGQLAAAAADEASGNVLQSNIRITHNRPQVIELGVFRASILGTQDIGFQLSADPNPDGSTTVEVKTTSHRWGQQTFLMIPTGPKYLLGKAPYVRFLTALAAKLSMADPTAKVSQYRTVA